MNDVSPGGSDLRETLTGAAIAGITAIVALLALTTAEFGSPVVRAILAVLLGVLVAQSYERILA